MNPGAMEIVVMDAANPYAPPQAVVHDVLVPYEGVEMAGLATRFAAAILDGIILVFAVYVPFVVALVASEGGAGPASVMIQMVASVVGVAAFIAWCWFTVVYVIRNGQSIGKKILEIKVVRSDGSAATFSRIFWLRNVVNTMIGVIPFYWFLDHLFIFGGARQCLHDKIADTIVVKA